MPYIDPEQRRQNQNQSYANNTAIYRARVAATKTRLKKEAMAFVFEYLQTHHCVDCGETDPIVLEFDHRPGEQKRFTIGQISSRNFSLSVIKQEIDKCDVRCANCHRRITYARAGRTHRSPKKLT